MKPEIFMFLIILLLAGTTTFSAQINLDSGLVAYYPFNGNANDESNNGNDGTVMGALLTTDRFGLDSAAYEFDGTSSYIAVPNSQTLQSPDTALSQVAWINIYSWSLVGTTFGPILMKSNSGTNAFQYRLSVGPVGINTSINNWLNFVTTPDTLNFNEWIMIASVLSNDTVSHYVNETFLGSGVLSGPIVTDNRPLEIGRDVPGVTEIFHGKLDEVRIYNRALTFQEIQELYGISSGIEDDLGMRPIRFQLRQNYPNPFNPSTTIEFDLPKSCEVTLIIYNLLGEEVITLLSASLLSGSHSIEWDASDLASGVYLYRLQAGNYVETRKMVLMR